MSNFSSGFALFCPSLSSLGQSACQMWSQFSAPLTPPQPPIPPPHSPAALKCIGCLRAKWTGLGRERGSPNGKPCSAIRRSINQAAKRTLEKVPSKQTDLSHDSRGSAGPHRSQLATLSQWEYSAESTMSSFLWHRHWDLMPDWMQFSIRCSRNQMQITN